MDYNEYRLERTKIRIDLLRDESKYMTNRIEHLTHKRKVINEEIKSLKGFIDSIENTTDESTTTKVD